MGSRSSAICGRSIKRCRFNDQSMLNCYQRWTPSLRVSTGQREREDEWEGRGGVTEKEKEERREYGRKELLSKVDFKSSSLRVSIGRREKEEAELHAISLSWQHWSWCLLQWFAVIGILYFAYSTESSLSHTQKTKEKEREYSAPFVWKLACYIIDMNSVKHWYFSNGIKWNEGQKPNTLEQLP